MNEEKQKYYTRKDIEKPNERRRNGIDRNEKSRRNRTKKQRKNEGITYNADYKN